MVTSLDGATAIRGRSGGLGSRADRAVFHTLRGLADVVLVGAGTVRAEGYGPVRATLATEEARVARGQEPRARLAIVSARLDLDLDAALFTESDPPPLVITTAEAPSARRVEAARCADLVLAGQGPRVHLPTALQVLGELGAGFVLCEGGASLNAQFLEHDLVDELCLTLAPLVVVGTSGRLAHGAELATPLGFALGHLLHAGDELFLRALRQRDEP
jgi:riboflavin biosynthesis pyrimidine reductase